MNYIYRQFSILNYAGVIFLYNVRITYVQVITVLLNSIQVIIVGYQYSGIMIFIKSKATEF